MTSSDRPVSLRRFTLEQTEKAVDYFINKVTLSWEKKEKERQCNIVKDIGLWNQTDQGLN